jgi:8-oxo-dGTP diphosphatase
MKQIVVTCALIQKGDTYLLTQRPQDKHNGGRREFPGGKVDFGEDSRVCLKREIQEELGIDIVVGELFECSSCVYDEVKHVLLLAYHCTYVSGEIVFHDVADIAWVTIEEMTDYDITEADIPFIQKLML